MKQNNLSRRRFLGMVGAAGGSTAVYQTARAMGLLQESGPVARLDLQQAGPVGRKVAVLGAGLSGLAAAYELEQAGYDVTIIEASHRAGGRNLTLRHGDKVDEMGYDQVCKFDDDPEMYFNAGPARIPGHHRRVLHYCRKFGVELQVKANMSRPAWRHDPDRFAGEPVRNSRYIADARGFLSELVYKAADQNVFDSPLSAEEIDRVRAFASSFGDLNDEGKYVGSRRGGYDAGFAYPAEIHPPLDIAALLDSRFWAGGLALDENPDWAEPLLEAKGGMDNIVQGFVRNIKSPILTNAQVQSIQNRSDGIDVVYNHKGQRHKIGADWCFNCIPTHFMVGIPNNLSQEYRAGLAALQPGNFCKIGFQMKERFWEREGIYGGITNTNQRINQIWYPSHGIHGKKGVVLGAYAFWTQSRFFERMTPAERLQYAAECGDKVHPGYSDYIEAGVSVPWARMNYMMGCGTAWSPEEREQYYELLQQPDGRHYMIGDQISYHSSWQEGAFASAEVALLDLNERARAASSISRNS